jgi:hypothetical protein
MQRNLPFNPEFARYKIAKDILSAHQEESLILTRLLNEGLEIVVRYCKIETERQPRKRQILNHTEKARGTAPAPEPPSPEGTTAAKKGPKKGIRTKS